MKKLYTIVILICCLMSVSAWADVANFNFLKAYSLENIGNLISGDNSVKAKKGDFCFELSMRNEDNSETLVAHLYASTATRSTQNLAGAYRLGVIGSYSYLYDSDKTIKCLSGSLYIECVGDTTISVVKDKQMKMPLYRIRLFDVVSTEGEVFALQGARIPAMCIDKAVYDALDSHDENNDGWFYFPADKPLNATEIETTVYAIEDYTGSKGVWLAQGLDLDKSNYEVILVVPSNSITGAAPSVMTIGKNNSQLTCLFEYNGDMTQVTPINISSGYGVVWEQNSVRYYDFYLTSADNVVYHIKMTSDYVMLFDTESAIEHSYSSAAVSKDNRSVSVFAKDAGSITDLVFYVNDYDKDIVLPEGTYTISADRAPQTMKASRGIDRGSLNLDPSFFTTLDADGKADEIAYFVSGTAVVANIDGKLNIKIDAVNSLNKNIRINISATVTDVPDIEADNQNTDVVKTLDGNGNIVIIRSGIRYNIQGQRL